MNYAELKSAAQSNGPVTLPAEMEIFTHHFPVAPLLPGALSALMIAETCGGPGWSLQRMNGVRFRKPLLPNLAVTLSCTVLEETPTERKCAGKLQNGADTIADGEFVFAKAALAPAVGSGPAAVKCIWSARQIREYLPHGEPIVLIDELVSAEYPQIIKDQLADPAAPELDQAHLVGTKVHTRTKLSAGNFWLDDGALPSPILSEMVAQASALTLSPFFKGTKPEVALLGCDTEYYGLAQAGSTIDAYVELTRVKKLGKTANMILFKSECFIGTTKIAQVNLNAMANFAP